MTSTTRKSLLLSAILIIHVLCWIGLKPPVPHSDDKVYVAVGESIADGSYTLNASPKNHRFTVILPAMLLARIAGPSPWITALWPLVCSLATLAVLFLWLYPVDRFVAATACLLLSLNVVQVIYATVLFPDVIVSFFSLLVVVFVFRGRETGNTMYALAAVAAMVLGFFAKEIILVLLPFLLLVCINDYRRRRSVRFWNTLSGGLVISIVAITWWVYAVTGDALFYIHSVETQHNDVFVPAMSPAVLAARLTYGPLVWLLLQPGYVFLVALAFPWLLRARHGPERQWKWLLVCLLAVFWWGTTSPVRMAPLPLYDRMWMPLLAPLCVAGAFAIRQAVGQGDRKHVAVHALPFLAAALLWIVLSPGNMPLVFLAYAVLLIWPVRFRLLNEAGTRLVMLIPYAAVTVYFILTNTNH